MEGVGDRRLKVVDGRLVKTINSYIIAGLWGPHSWGGSLGWSETKTYPSPSLISGRKRGDDGI